jgi:hypothetical protein
MMNKSLLAHSAKSSRKSIYGFQQVRILKRRCAKSTLQKKSRRFRRLLKLITGRRQTEWTGATRCPNKDDPSHKRESLINRKGAISFRLCLPCRPLAECGCSSRDGGRIPLHESSRQAPGSPFGRAVLATLEEKAASCRLLPVVPGTFRSPEHLARVAGADEGPAEPAGHHLGSRG